jgi:hypothetical protein
MQNAEKLLDQETLNEGRTVSGFSAKNTLKEITPSLYLKCNIILMILFSDI